ncbi:MAG: hypothetical protein HYV46_05050 [candidate division NC10 bacterium]|nr:hypothetical protein [candidate division NC10 bacterium]
MMDTFQIFGLQVLLSLVGYALIAKWYVVPRLAALPLHDALIPLIFPHAFRHVGMVFLVPAVVAPTLPPAFALPAAYGDLFTALLALLALLALRSRWPLAPSVTWLFNVVGTLDLVYAFIQGTRLDATAHMGSAWYIPTFLVPALFVTHFLHGNPTSSYLLAQYHSSRGFSGPMDCPGPDRHRQIRQARDRVPVL